MMSLNPFNVDDDIISLKIKILGIHDDNVVEAQDVDSLFKVVSNIVRRSSTNSTDSLNLKQMTVDLVEDKVPESAFMPKARELKEIAYQMTTCESFTESNAHKSVVRVLEELKSYRWDAKAVIALSAFAWDCGQTWRLSLLQGNNNKNALDLRVVRLAKEKNNNPSQSDSNLINDTLKLIEMIINLEKFFAVKSYTRRNVPTLSEAPRDVYTYWAVFSLFACANQTEPDMKNKLVEKIASVLAELTANLDKIKKEIEQYQDLIWRIEAFGNPSGILQLLKALIYPKDSNISKELVSSKVTLEELKTKNLFLFISGLDNIEHQIESLKSIYSAITNDEDKKDYQILWVPVVENWSKEAEKKFESLKCSMPWYVLQYKSLIEGYRVLQQEWNYHGKPIVVVTDSSGKVLNKNALHPINLWGLEAFPYDPEKIKEVYRHWNWFWHGVLFNNNIHPPIQTWLKSQDKYVIFYGGTATWTKKFHDLVDGIKKELEETKPYIEHFNLGATDTKTQNRFWSSISQTLQSYPPNDDSTLNEIQWLLAMRSQEGWAIVSKGKQVFLTGYNEVMLNVLKGFKEWRANISVSGFDGAIYKHYSQLLKPQDRPSMKMQLDNIHSREFIPYYCPDPKCTRMMETSSVTYECCHGMHCTI